VFFGAEFTRAWSDYKYGGKVEPADYAAKDTKAILMKKQDENDAPSGSSSEDSR